ncbi:MAG: hypothetical protein IJI01_14145 [Butyrivibrio sp.]|uniref:hypothetical protein n=1 Tax=Butyrivibrio sp. TaxID=28121 RepID=UPI0025C41114|nr:hypothetical protein [Butyrivibrio sp.]MBQ6589802.1 hypothetical protein [Butyrivibrio sp.]
MSENIVNMSNSFKKNGKIIDTINYNGKYVDVSVIRKRVLSITAALAALACFAVIFLL